MNVDGCARGGGGCRVGTGGEHGEGGGRAPEREPGVPNQGYGEVEDGDVVVPAAGPVIWCGTGRSATIDECDCQSSRTTHPMRYAHSFTI